MFPNLVPVPPPDWNKDKTCFLCSAPIPVNVEDCEAAYLGGFTDGLLCAKYGDRKVLCVKHETLLREILVQFLDGPMIKRLLKIP